MYKILLIDDAPNWQDVVKDILIPPEFDIQIASTYKQARQIIEQPFDLILVDLCLTDDNDFEGVAILEDLVSLGVKTPRIILSAYVQETRHWLHEFKSHDVIFKNAKFNKANFRRSVLDALQLSSHQAEPQHPEVYIDFELHVTDQGFITAYSEAGQSSTIQISLDIPNTVTTKLALIEQGNVDAQILRSFGIHLYNILFPSVIHTHLQQTEAVASYSRAKVRLRLHIENDKLAILPWEFLYRSLGGYFIAINPNIALSRYLNVPLPLGRSEYIDKTMHLLIIVANPNDQTPLDPDRWESIITDAVKKLTSINRLVLHVIKRATRKEIRNKLLQQKPHIIQFVGHGAYINGKGYLALVDEITGGTWLVDENQFANIFLGADEHLLLVSLATCDSAKSNSPQGFCGIAPQIIQRGVPAVIAMQYSAQIRSMHIFLETLYTSLAAYKPLDWAVQAARNAVSQELGFENREFATPVLFMRSKNGQIF